MKLRWQRSAALVLTLLLSAALVTVVNGAQAKAAAAAAALPGQCSNGRRDGTETDIDCGGEDCSRRCNLKQSCNTGADCKSGTCDPTAKKCDCPAGLIVDAASLTCYSQQAMCYNRKRDKSEGDVDCGGSCSKKCALNQACLVGSDCLYGVCLNPSKRCGCPLEQMISPDKRSCVPQIPQSLKDVSPGNTRSNVSRSGSLAASLGGLLNPNNGKEAAAGFKQQGSSQINPNDPCWNGVRDGQESDVDCGGYTCYKCDIGKSCRQSSDCASGTCSPSSKKCICPPGTAAAAGGGGSCLQVPKPLSATTSSDHCTNGKFDSGLEGDVDCGGKCPNRCNFGNACQVTADCRAGICNPDQRVCMCPRGQTMSPDMSTCLTKEELCFNGAKDSEESDVDCGGPCGSKCKFGQVCKANADCETTVCSSGNSSSTGSSSSGGVRLCACPSSAPLSTDGSKCLTKCDTGPNPCSNGGKCLPAPGLNPNFKCSCQPGSNGTLCDKQVSTCDVQNPCRNGGKCIRNPGWVPGKTGAPDFRCSCMQGYSGTTCEVARSSCTADPNICRNGGTCVPLPGQSPDFQCTCRPGWSGRNCNQQVTGSTAAAVAGVTGRVNNVTSVSLSGNNTANNNQGQPDACSLAGIACLNGGVCVVAEGSNDSSDEGGSSVVGTAVSNVTNNVTCQCPADYDGAACEIQLNTCDWNNQCVHGDCFSINGDPDFQCNCTAGYSGTFCDSTNSIQGTNSSLNSSGTNSSSCADVNPCLHGGSCKQLSVADDASYDTSYNVDFECECPEGFYGTKCEIKVNPCAAGPNPCGEHGVCQPAAAAAAAGNATATAAGAGNASTAATAAAAVLDGFICTCNTGFTGRYCDKPAVTVVTVSPNNGSAVTVTTSSSTACDTANPCRNGGTCNPKPGSTPDYSCTCPTGFSGTLCQTSNDTCAFLKPCQNSGNCISQPGSSPDYKCSCGPGFAGSQCEQDCYAKGLVPDRPAGLSCVPPSSSSNSSNSSSGSGGSGGGSGASDVEVPVLPANSSGLSSCGVSASRLCSPGEVCGTADDCEGSTECRSFPALDRSRRCACSKGSFIVLQGDGSPKCITQAEMCSNGVRDVYEGDVDCGFYCEKLCGLGRSCRGSSGCASGFCEMTTQKCACGSGTVLSADGQSCTPQQ